MDDYDPYRVKLRSELAFLRQLGLIPDRPLCRAELLPLLWKLQSRTEGRPRGTNPETLSTVHWAFSQGLSYKKVREVVLRVLGRTIGDQQLASIKRADLEGPMKAMVTTSSVTESASLIRCLPDDPDTLY
jgi:hypothetical protein